MEVCLAKPSKASQYGHTIAREQTHHHEKFGGNAARPSRVSFIFYRISQLCILDLVFVATLDYYKYTYCRKISLRTYIGSCYINPAQFPVEQSKPVASNCSGLGSLELSKHSPCSIEHTSGRACVAVCGKSFQNNCTITQF